MNASSVNWRNKIHDNITLKNYLSIFFKQNFRLGNFSGNLGKFRGNSAPNRVQIKNPLQCIKD